MAFEVILGCLTLKLTQIHLGKGTTGMLELIKCFWGFIGGKHSILTKSIIIVY